MMISQERTIAEMGVWLEEKRSWRKEMMACQEVMEACLEQMEARTETDQEPKEAKSKTCLEDVKVLDVEVNPKEIGSAMKTVGIREDRCEEQQWISGSRNPLNS
jgi:hypothetical protein